MDLTHGPALPTTPGYSRAARGIYDDPLSRRCSGCTGYADDHDPTCRRILAVDTGVVHGPMTAVAAESVHVIGATGHRIP